MWDEDTEDSPDNEDTEGNEVRCEECGCFFNVPIFNCTKCCPRCGCEYNR